MKKHIKKGLPLILATLITTPALAYYDVTIGTTDTAGVWNGNEWIPSGTGSTVSVTTIQNKLADGPVTIGTGTDSDGGAEVGDITVSSAVSWDANTLTLTAANELNINAVMTAGGSAGLAINARPWDHDGRYGIINTGMGNGGFVGRVDFTGSDNTITINGTSSIIITTLGSEGGYCDDSGLQGLKLVTGSYVLGADIDATPTASWNGGAGFRPLGTNCGVYAQFVPRIEGMGHTIDGLTINRPTEDTVGLARVLTEGASNLGLTNVNIVGGNAVGALGGFNSDSHVYRFSNIYITGSVTGVNSVGGLIGRAWNTTSPIGSYNLITNVYVDANVSGNNVVGGLFGYSSIAVRVDGAYTTGTVSGASQVGGLIGMMEYWDQVITNVHSTATVISSWDGSGTIGYVPDFTTSSIHLTYFDGLLNIASWLCDPLNPDEKLTIPEPRAHYYNGDTVHTCSTTTAPIDSLYTTPLTNAQMKQQASYAGFDFTNTWVIYEGQTTPILRKMEGLFDSDGDGYYNNEDAFPADPAKWYESPDAFVFNGRADVVPNTVITSNTITVNGISHATPVSITSCTADACQYAINHGEWSSDAGKVSNGDVIQVRQTSSSQYTTATSLTLTIGDVAGSFSVTTRSASVEDGSTSDGSSTGSTGTSGTGSSGADSTNSESSSTAGTDTGSSGSGSSGARGGGCTINPQAGFDPTLLLMLGASLLYLRRRQSKDRECSKVA